MLQLEFKFNPLAADLRGKTGSTWPPGTVTSPRGRAAGASRVVALDGYAWSVDWRAYHKDHVAANEAGVRPPSPTSRGTRADDLPGGGFRRPREILGSRVEPVVGNYLTMDLHELGQFDVVLYLGVLYHMETRSGRCGGFSR